MFGLGGNKSSSKSSQSSTEQSTSKQSIAFSDLFGKMYGSAATKAASMTGDAFGSSANQLFSGGMQFLANLGGGPEQDYMQARLSGPDEALQAQIATMREQMGQLFNEQINPAITSDAVRSGTLGGGRQGVAQGVASSGLMREFGAGVSGLMAQSQAARDSLAVEGRRAGAAESQIGLGSLSSLLGLAESREGASFLPESLLARILGSPTVLGESQSTASSQGKSKSSSAGFSLGFGG